MAVKRFWYVCLVPSMNWNALERRKSNMAQLVIVFLCSYLGMCMLLPAYPLMCASLHDCKTHFNLLIHFTWCACTLPSNPVRACGKEEPTGRSSNFATGLLFSLFNRRLISIRIMGLSVCRRAPPTNKQSHTKKPRWITRTARAVLGVNFS